MCMLVLLLPLFTLMQVRIAAHDDIYPRAVATATVEVTMLRNENRPTWSHETPLRLTLNRGSNWAMSSLTYRIVDSIISSGGR